MLSRFLAHTPSPLRPRKFHARLSSALSKVKDVVVRVVRRRRSHHLLNALAIVILLPNALVQLRKQPALAGLHALLALAWLRQLLLPGLPQPGLSLRAVDLAHGGLLLLSLLGQEALLCGVGALVLPGLLQLGLPLLVVDLAQGRFLLVQLSGQEETLLRCFGGNGAVCGGGLSLLFLFVLGNAALYTDFLTLGE